MSIRLSDMQIIVQAARRAEQIQQQQQQGQAQAQAHLAQNWQTEAMLSLRKPNKMESKTKPETEDSQVANRMRRYSARKRKGAEAESGRLDVVA